MEIVAPHRKEMFRAVYALKVGTRYKAAKRMEEDNVR